MQYADQVQIRNYPKTIAEVVARIEEKTKELSDWSDQVEALKLEHSNLQHEILARQAKIKELDTTIETKLARNNDVDNGLTNLRTESKNLSASVLSNTVEIERQEKLIEENAKELSRLQTKLATAGKDLKVLIDTIESSNARVRALEEAKKSLQAEVQAGIISVEEAAEKKVQIDADLSEAQENFRLAQQRIEAFKEETGFAIAYNASALSEK